MSLMLALRFLYPTTFEISRQLSERRIDMSCIGLTIIQTLRKTLIGAAWARQRETFAQASVVFRVVSIQKIETRGEL